MPLPAVAREALGLPKTGKLPKAANLRLTGTQMVREGERRLLNLLPQAVDRLERALSSDDEATSVKAAKLIMDRVLGTPAKSHTPPAERPPKMTEESASDLLKSLSKHLPDETVRQMQALWVQGLRDSGQLQDPGESVSQSAD